jgi:hypothetical protein
MRSRSLLLIFIAVFSIITIAKIPLALAVPNDQGAQADGTIWDGAVDNINTPFGPATIEFNASAASLLSLSLGGSWTFKAPAANGAGLAERRLSGETYISDSRMQINLAAMRLEKALIGDVNMAITELGFTDDSRCIEASGTVQSDVLERNRSTLRWTGPTLSGPIACDGNDFIMTLSGQDDVADINFVYRLIPNGSYRSIATVKTDNPLLKTALSAEGFIADGNVMTRGFDGNWR